MAGSMERGTVPVTLETDYLLSRAPGSELRPLVVLLHGQGMRGDKMLELSGLGGDALRHVLAPDGLYPVEKRRPIGTKPAKPNEIGHAWYMYTGDQADFRRELERG